MKISRVNIVIFGAAVVLFMVAVNSSFGAKKTAVKAPLKTPIAPLQLSISEIETGSYQALVTAFGEVKARNELDLVAEVSGQLLSVPQQLLNGKRYRAGEVIMQLDDINYIAALATAKSTLATAEVDLLQQQRYHQQALQEWQRSGLKGQPDSSLVLYEPQLKAAQAKFEAAQKSLIKARAELAKTEIKSPFNAFLVQRYVSLGSYVQAGSQLVQLYSDDVVEVALPLSALQWRNLGKFDATNLPTVTLSNRQGDATWQAKISSRELHLDSSSRQRALIVEVESPLEQNPPLYPGTFVRAQIKAQETNNLWQIPASAITEDNTILYLQTDNTLASAKVQKHFSNKEQVYISPLAKQKKVRLVTHPLSSYLPGMRAVPRPNAQAADQSSVNANKVPTKKAMKNDVS